jgi:hypothetical protein
MAMTKRAERVRSCAMSRLDLVSRRLQLMTSTIVGMPSSRAHRAAM